MEISNEGANRTEHHLTFFCKLRPRCIIQVAVSYAKDFYKCLKRIIFVHSHSFACRHI